MSKLVYASIFTVLLLANLIFIGDASASTSVSGLITSDTTWSLTNSPYQLTGPVGVISGVTLTIEAGVTVNLATHYISVNGTLIAKGTSNQKIVFNSDTQDTSISFRTNSTSWNEQTGFGCIIQNAVVNSGISIGEGVSPKIDSNTITGDFLMISGAPTISNNIINEEIHIMSGAPVITGNTINSFIVGSGRGPIIISKNILTGHFSDVIEGAGICCNNAIIADNIITHFQRGIVLYAGTNTIERNALVDNTVGIQLGLSSSGTYGLFQTTIQNNLIADNSKGISLSDLAQTIMKGNLSVTIQNNNIQNNRDYNLYSSVTVPINAVANWWGTTDTQAINQTIYDVKNNYNLGTVTFVPFLTSPDSTAPAMPTDLIANSSPTPTMPDASTPTATLNPIPTPSGNTPGNPTEHPQEQSAQKNESSTLNWTELAVIVICVIVGVLTAVLLLSRYRRTVAPH